jgi:predicted DNA-binding protein (UPF0251 family)
MPHTQCASCHKLFPFSRITEEIHRCGLGRKKKKRTLSEKSSTTTTILKPQGIPLSKTKILTISADELEALKLKNIENLHQVAIAEKMSVSQSTLARTLKQANKKLTLALVNGWSIKLNNKQI